MRRALGFLAAALGAVGAEGCYTYAPLSSMAPDPGSVVAVTLTDSGTQELASYLGPTVAVVRGRYLGGGDTAGLRIAVASVELVRGDVLPWAGELVTIPGHDVADIKVRRPARGRSVLLAGAAVGGVVASTAAFSLLLQGQSTPTNPTGPPPTKK
jgi:hypothetical protein